MSSIFARFHRDERGAIVLLFGLMLIPLIGIVGLAIDSARAFAVRNQLQQAVDAAALAGGRVFTLSPAQRDTVITSFFNQNLQSTRFGATLSAPLTINANPGTGTLRVSANANMPVTLMKVMGFNTVPVASSAIVEKKEEMKMEATLVLDVSGSMVGTKIANLKTAVGNFLDIVYNPPNHPDPKIQISIVSWDDGVYVSSALKNPGNFLLAGEPAGQPGFTLPDPSSLLWQSDDKPLAMLKATPFGWQGWWAWNNGILYVIDQTHNLALPLRDDPVVIKSFVNDLEAAASTGSPGGMFWGWRTISPQWRHEWQGVPGSLPRSYTEPQNLKAVILMTDGENNRMRYTGGYFAPATPAPINALALTQCAAMKAKGIRIYTIGFNLSSPTADSANMLRSCASSPSTFFYSSTPAALIAAFGAIASDLTALRLTH